MMSQLLKLLGVEDANAAESQSAPSIQQFLNPQAAQDRFNQRAMSERKPDPVSRKVKTDYSKPKAYDSVINKEAYNYEKNPQNITNSKIDDLLKRANSRLNDVEQAGEKSLDQAESEYMFNKNPTQWAMNEVKKLASTPGTDAKISFQKPQVISPIENATMMGNAKAIMNQFGTGKFDSETLAPDASNYRDRILAQIAKAEKGDKTDLAPMLKALGRVSGSDLAKGYETNDAMSNRLSAILQDSNLKTSGVYDKNDRTLIDLYKGQKLPPTLVSAQANMDAPRAPAGSGRGQKDKEITRQEAEGISKATAGLGLLTTTKTKLKDLLPKMSILSAQLHSLSPRIGNFFASTSENQAATTEAISLMTDLAARYALEISGKAVTDQEQARLQIVQQLAPFTTREGLAKGIDKLLTDFERQLSLQATSLGDRRVGQFTTNTGVDPRKVSQDAKTAIYGNSNSSTEIEKNNKRMAEIKAKLGK